MAPQSPLATDDLDGLVARRSWRALAAALGGADDDEPTRRLRGELALAGSAPLVDALIAARGAQASGALQQRVAAALRRAGLGAAFPADGDATPAVDPIAEALAAIAQRRAARDFAAARDQANALAAAWPDADAVHDEGLAWALDAWAAGDDDALARLRAVRDAADGRSGDRSAAALALDAIELHPAAAQHPAWLTASVVLPEGPCGTIGALLSGLLGASVDVAPAPTASHLRAALHAAGVASVRVTLDEALLERVLGRTGVLVVLEEEQAAAAQFLLVMAVERTAKLLLVADPATPGAVIRPSQLQWRRSALAGRGALLVLGTGEAGDAARAALAAIGIIDDARLELVDRAHFDPADPEVPHAHVAQLARDAIAAAPDVPMAHRRLGEALLALGKLGRLDDDELQLEQWVKATRYRFPDAEWPLQLYAQALELWRRWPEALVAWADAEQLDPDDHRNHLGQARAVRQLGGLRGARQRLRKAATLAPDHPDVWRWLAAEELDEGNLEAAAAAADLAAVHGADDPELLVIRATLAEHHGDHAAAGRALAAAVAGDAAEHGQSMRWYRHQLWRGALPELPPLTGRRFVQRYPGSSNAWAIHIDALLTSGDARGALEAVFASLQRCAMQGDLVDQTVSALLFAVAPDELSEAYGAIEARLAGVADPLVRIARGLAYDGGRLDVAVPALERLAARYPGDVNAPYSLAQVLMAGGQGDDPRVAASLRRALAQAPGFPWVRYLLAEVTLPTAPGDVPALVDPVIGAAPALFWDQLARAYAAMGNAEASATLRARIEEVAGGVLEHAGFLRRNRVLAPLAALLDVATARAPGLGVDIERAALRRDAGDHAGAAELLAPAWASRPSGWLGRALVHAAAYAGPAARAQDLAAQVAAHIRRRTDVAGDPWPTLAIAAGASAAAGDEAPRRALREHVADHPLAMLALVRAERHLAAPHLADDTAHLLALAPGAAALLTHPEF